MWEFNALPLTNQSIWKIRIRPWAYNYKSLVFLNTRILKHRWFVHFSDVLQNSNFQGNATFCFADPYRRLYWLFFLYCFIDVFAFVTKGWNNEDGSRLKSKRRTLSVAGITINSFMTFIALTKDRCVHIFAILVVTAEDHNCMFQKIKISWLINLWWQLANTPYKTLILVFGYFSSVATAVRGCSYSREWYHSRRTRGARKLQRGIWRIDSCEGKKGKETYWQRFYFILLNSVIKELYELLLTYQSHV